LNITSPTGTVLYFAYMGMVTITFFLLTGSIGFFSCLWFVKRIYGAIKVDWMWLCNKSFLFFHWCTWYFNIAFDKLLFY
jgi:hypothetical protein